MKQFVTLTFLLVLCASFATAQVYPTVSIHDLQFVSPDTLLKCDTLGINAGLSGWLKQTSAYYISNTGNVRDTVEIVGEVIIPPKIIAFTGPNTPYPPGVWDGSSAYNIVLKDTNSSLTQWNSIFVRPSSAADTAALFNSGYLGMNVGDIIRLRGYADEFPSTNMASGTQLVPVTQNFITTSTMPNGPIEFLGHKTPSAPIQATANKFYKGSFPSGKVMFSTGEPLEGAYVQLTNLKVSGIVNSTNGTFAMQDSAGNEISVLDGSTWFSLRGHKNPASTYALPSIGQVVLSVRGYISTNSGSESPRGYRINPCFPGDLVLGNVFPGVSTHRRNPVALTSTDTALVSIKAFTQFGGAPIRRVVLKHSLNNGAWITDTMKGPASDSSWTAKLVPQPANTFVKYYCEAMDTLGNKSIYASAAAGSASADTSQGFFFFTVLDRPLTIRDIQYTPYANGYSGFLGAVVTVKGVVTADTSNVSLLSSGTTPWYIQSSNAPWSGIWTTGIDTLLSKIHLGDSVSVTGTVQEYLNGTTGSVGRVTRIANDTAVSILASARPLPAPVVSTTNSFNVGNGASSAEPYEGMLVRFNNVTVTDTAPTFADKSEFAADDGSGPILVRGSDGKNQYTNEPGKVGPGITLLKPGDKFTYIQGIVYFSFNQYKLVPRGNIDYGSYNTGVVAVGNSVPQKFALSQNYPNPFNPSTKIEFDIPKAGNVSLKIFNLLGQEVASLVDGTSNAGHFVAQFDAARLSSGVYFYRLQSVSGMIVRKMLLLK
jgi:hypothetical protein